VAAVVEAAGIAGPRPRLIRSVAGHNLGLLMRHLIGAGTPKEAAARGRLLLLVVYTDDFLAVVVLAVAATSGEEDCGFFLLAINPDPA